MKAELRLNPMGAGGQVLLDGQDVSAGVRALHLHGEVGHFTTLQLDLNLHDVMPVNAELEVLIPDATRDLLVRLGWTPPEGVA